MTAFGSIALMDADLSRLPDRMWSAHDGQS